MSELQRIIYKKAWTQIAVGAGVAIFSMYVLSALNIYIAMVGMLIGAIYANFYTNTKCPLCKAHFGVHPTLFKPVHVPDKCMACKADISMNSVDL